MLALQPELALSQSIVKPQGAQQVVVLVRDQNELPVVGASVTLSAALSRRGAHLPPPLTDAEGITRIDLEFDSQIPGSNIELLAWAVYQELRASTRDSFRIWW